MKNTKQTGNSKLSELSIEELRTQFWKNQKEVCNEIKSR